MNLWIGVTGKVWFQQLRGDVRRGLDSGPTTAAGSSARLLQYSDAD